MFVQDLAQCSILIGSSECYCATDNNIMLNQGKMFFHLFLTLDKGQSLPVSLLHTQPAPKRLKNKQTNLFGVAGCCLLKHEMQFG